MAAKPVSRSSAQLRALHDSRVERAIRLALTLVADAESHDLLIALALDYAVVDALPEGGADLSLFVRGPLHAAVVTLFGEAAAEEVCDEVCCYLDDLIAEASTSTTSGLRPRLRLAPTSQPPKDEPAGLFSASEPPRAETAKRKDTIPAPKPGTKTVYLVTRDGRTYSQIATELGEQGAVVCLSGAASILDTLRREETTVPVVVVDCRFGASDSMLATIAPELSGQTKVILWGNDLQVYTQLSRVKNPSKDWIRMAAEADGLDLAAMLRSML